MENFFPGTYFGRLGRRIILSLPPFSEGLHRVEMVFLEANTMLGGIKLATARFKMETLWLRKYGERVKRRAMELKRFVSEAEREFEGEEMIVKEVKGSEEEVEMDIEVENDFKKVIEDNERSRKELQEAMRDVLGSDRNPLGILWGVMEKLKRETEEIGEDHLGSSREFQEAKRDLEGAVRDLEAAGGLQELLMKFHLE